MAYSIEFTPAAQRQFKKLDRNTRRRIGRRIDALAENPRPDGVVKLTDVSPSLYRIREGDNRIVYAIEDSRLLVLVVRIAHRSDIYR
ncbi:MAG: type II toxin-antitoxin system RelE/ParE family toxin [Acidobacteria bacterium]|nr:MAG: type II toxin-antitoxin system RelE/ParE family toxin [Acidobacteriota bacterium]